MKILPLALLLSAAAIPALTQPQQPDAVLYQMGLKDETAGRLDRARLTLVTLASTYTSSPLADKARIELGAIVLYQEAKAQEKAGRAQEAYSEYRTLMRAFPDSPVARLADESAKALGFPSDPRR
jgi:outer membrane protein assembly factor BamD (BamD/ComL family)